jgi:hypothetical protein
MGMWAAGDGQEANSRGGGGGTNLKGELEGSVQRAGQVSVSGDPSSVVNIVSSERIHFEALCVFPLNCVRWISTWPSAAGQLDDGLMRVSGLAPSAPP